LAFKREGFGGLGARRFDRAGVLLAEALEGGRREGIFLAADALRQRFVRHRLCAEPRSYSDVNCLCDYWRVNLKQITVLEIKSSRKRLKPGFGGYFFSLTAGEVLVAQSLRDQFRFALVDTTTGEHLELTLAEVFAKAKGIYPTWSICF
jgi:hypothetical protein